MNNEKMESVPNFIAIESSVILDKRLNSTDKIIYGIIVALSNGKKRVCNCTNMYFENFIGIKKRKIQYSLEKLQKYDYIKIEFFNQKRIIQTFIDRKIFERNEKNGFNKEFEELEKFNWLEDIKEE